MEVTKDIRKGTKIDYMFPIALQSSYEMHICVKGVPWL